MIRSPSALFSALFLGVFALGCGSRLAPEEAPPVASVASIATAAPGASGVIIKESTAFTGGSGPRAPTPIGEIDEEDQPPDLPPSAAPAEPLPLPVEPVPSPFGEPPPTPLPKPPKGGGLDGTPPSKKGVQL